MPNDPKWRTIARVSNQSISSVLAVYVHLLVIASNATERGRTHAVRSEDLASALDLDIQQIDSILAAMQGRVLDGDWVSGWEKRQVEREDGSAERAKRWREAQKEAKQTHQNNNERNRTQPNATELQIRLDKELKSIISPTTENANGVPHEAEPTCAHQRVPESPSPAKPKRGTRLPENWTLPEDWRAEARKIRGSLTEAQITLIAESFRDYWVSAPKGLKLDWRATWRNWIRQQNKIPEPQKPKNLWVGTL